MYRRSTRLEGPLGRPPSAPPTEANKGIERRMATPQFISNFEICENDRRVSLATDIGTRGVETIAGTEE
jgi:hypothetical protein